ncbi:hypothetical protein, partial [Frankia sp. EI5c]
RTQYLLDNNYIVEIPVGDRKM